MKKGMILIFLIQAFWVSAQLDIGVRAGMNFSDIRFSNLESVDIIESTNKSEIGFHAGLFTRLNILSFYIQPELLYSQVNGVSEFTEVNTNEYSEPYKLHRVDIPILLGVNVGPVRLMAGPVANFNFNPASDVYNNTFKQGTWALQAGVGFQIWKIEADLKFETALTEYAREIDYNIGTDTHRAKMDTRNNMLVLSFGYKFSQK
jgi:hypothetical protein